MLLAIALASNVFPAKSHLSTSNDMEKIAILASYFPVGLRDYELSCKVVSQE